MSDAEGIQAFTVVVEALGATWTIKVDVPENYSLGFLVGSTSRSIIVGVVRDGASLEEVEWRRMLAKADRVVALRVATERVLRSSLIAIASRTVDS